MIVSVIYVKVWWYVGVLDQLEINMGMIQIPYKKGYRHPTQYAM